MKIDARVDTDAEHHHAATGEAVPMRRVTANDTTDLPELTDDASVRVHARFECPQDGEQFTVFIRLEWNPSKR